jgi:hypothetical protein
VDCAVISPSLRSDFWDGVMRKRRSCVTLGAAILATALAASDAPASSCLQAGQLETVKGRLSIGRFVDAADRPERPFILRLASPACLTDEALGDVKNARTVHVYAGKPALQAQLTRRVGAMILVRGKPFAQHTSHHHAPIVMEVSTVEPH